MPSKQRACHTFSCGHRLRQGQCSISGVLSSASASSGCAEVADGAGEGAAAVAAMPGADAGGTTGTTLRPRRHSRVGRTAPEQRQTRDRQALYRPCCLSVPFSPPSHHSIAQKVAVTASPIPHQCHSCSFLWPPSQTLLSVVGKPHACHLPQAPS